ncbi:MAG: aspartate aminotransferase family protein [Clostridiales bacterium]|jgi:acetylornithine/N-succinyldiaminopimelate aminotransferase|nr:aspartate aminotransferase family protein [Clostridiales bacterium]HOA33842.1 aspartate aminotransferase family protein [Clostridiales bacterium]HOJ35092.1 aspartate aminotransferase family protein [Clostridiales bacterium]HOL78948.1 aspartate aminotransferase family protein [Clostridiales bacterium]HPU66936.1 aspartate aminotransferase family protein [Clostridiales bacterium]
MSIFDNDRKYIADTYKRFKVAFVKGKGSLLYDVDGKEYIDLASGVAVNIFGICDDEWKEAVINQLNQIQHTSNMFYSLPQTELARILCERTGMKKVFFSNSGAEANETAIKAVRKYSYDKYGEGRHTIITLECSFHGRTMGALSATGQPAYHVGFGPILEGFVYTPANDVEKLRENVEKNNVCAIMLEFIQGEGGLNMLTEEFIKAAAEICKEKDILFIADEVQTGNGRTGKLYAYMHYGLEPDVITTAKGLGAGLPIGATMLGEKLKDVFAPGTHGATFGGNPVCAAGAVSVMNRLTDDLMAEVKEKGEYIKTQLKDAKGVKSVCGLGLMVGIETEAPPADVAQKAVENGVLVLTAKTKVRLLPPLNIPFEDLKRAVEILKKVIAEEAEKVK